MKTPSHCVQKWGNQLSIAPEPDTNWQTCEEAGQASEIYIPGNVKERVICADLDGRFCGACQVLDHAGADLLIRRRRKVRSCDPSASSGRRATASDGVGGRVRCRDYA